MLSMAMANFPKVWLHIIMLLALTILFYSSAVSSSNHGIPNYHDRCASVIPESTPTDQEFTVIPFPPNQDGYYFGGDEVLKHQDKSGFYYSSNDRRVLLFRTHTVYRTNADGVYKVEASLILQPGRITHSFGGSSTTFSSWTQDGALSFEIEGFWSISSGKLCMVGSASTHSGEGKHDGLSALVKLNDVRSQSNITSLIRGTLESLNSADESSYFHQISLLMFPLMNYTYTEVTKEADYGCIGDAVKNSIRLPLSFSFCSAFSQVNSFELQYSNDCSSTKNCNPFGEDDGYLPQIMSLSSFQCSDDRRSVRFLVEFQNSSYYSYYLPFNPNKTLVAEGSWNSQKNQLCMVACRISTPTNSLDSSLVEDCSSRLSLRFPAVLSMNSSSTMVGDMWSNKTVGVSGRFDNITFHIYGDNRIEIPGLKYEYTQIDRARNSCPKKQPMRSDGRKYPDGNPYNMQFQMSFGIRKVKVSNLWGYADLISVGDKIVPRNSFSSSSNSKVEETLQPVNMSYRMSMTSYNASVKKYEGFSISAEGVYDAERGVLCMVGCKHLESNDRVRTNNSIDCDIIVDIQFPPLNSGDRIKGHIRSTREKSSPQYFKSLSFSGFAYYSYGKSIWRMDLEIIMTLMSNTLICVFVGCQILYVKKHPNIFPFVSLLMLVVLTLGYMIPLVLNFEALFFSKQNGRSFLGSGGSWLEVNEVIVRIVTMVAFLLQVRLLQLVSSAKLADENQKAAWIAETKTLYVSLPLYMAGGLIALSINWKNYQFGGKDSMSVTYIDSKQHSLWMDSRSYGGLMLDGFLLPQIILNIFNNSTQNVLSRFFYMGTTFVRVLPHAYDIFRAHFLVDGLDWLYVYADPAGDYYSTAWDMIIPAGCMLFCGFIYIQQRNGGCCFLPKMLKETAGYEKVPVSGEM